MSETKICWKCKTEKDETDFYLNKNGKRQTMCIICKSEDARTPENKARQKAYREANKEKRYLAAKKWREANKEILKVKKKEYAIKTKEHISQHYKLYAAKNRAKISKYHKEWKIRNKEKVLAKKREYVNRRRKEDPIFKLTQVIRNRIRRGFRDRKMIGRPETVEMLGCTFQEAHTYIEARFKSGMTWENHGYGEGKWHLDHIHPLAAAEDKEGLIKLCHHTNLQPLWHQENIDKKDKVPTYEQMGR